MNTNHKYEYDDAIQLLKDNFVNNRGSLTKKDNKYTPTAKEYKAIDYLFMEWDYEYLEAKCGT